jgi:hypothetical protein
MSLVSNNCRSVTSPFWTGLVELSVIAGIFSLALGCGKTQDPNRLPVFPTSGKVSLQGKVPAGAFLVLHPKNATPATESVRPRAHVKQDGSFELSSYESNDGAPAGEYAVTVEWRQTIKFPNGDAGPGPNLVPRHYSRPETSPVTVNIAEGPNQLDPIVLK